MHSNFSVIVAVPKMMLTNEQRLGFNLFPIVCVSLETALTVFRLFDIGFCLFHISCEYNSPFIQSHQHCTHFRRFRLFSHLFILFFSHLTSILFTDFTNNHLFNSNYLDWHRNSQIEYRLWRTVRLFSFILNFFCLTFQPYFQKRCEGHTVGHKA